jgi:carboxylate-amine ligase
MATGCENGGVRTVGVEEEFLLVAARHDHVAGVASEVLRVAATRGDAGGEVVGGQVRGALVPEFLEEQLEAYTSPHRAMPMLEAELRAWRATASSAAAAVGARIVASATSPLPVVPCHVRTERYDRIAERFGFVVRDQLTCGCHVHVSIASPQEAVGVLDRIRVWLPVLLALSANSPFWQGHDTGYASFRNHVLGRWPVSGSTDVFGSVERYREVVDSLVAADVILDEAMLYFDARCSRRYPTVEIRMPDVCLDVSDTVLLAALCRALVDTSAEEWSAGGPPPPTPTALLRLASWRAARWGTGERLLDPVTSRPRPAEDVVRRLLDHVRPALDRNHDEALVARGIDRIFDRGSGATLQRDVMASAGNLTEVVAALAQATRSHQE